MNPHPMIHMKNQALFSSKDLSKKLKCGHLLQFLFGALRVKCDCLSAQYTPFLSPI